MPLQVLSILQEVFPAVEAAEMAVKLNPLWWEGWQTLGRAQLNLGEVDLVSPSERNKKMAEHRLKGGTKVENILTVLLNRLREFISHRVFVSFLFFAGVFPSSTSRPDA